MKYIYTHHVLKRLDERFTGLIDIDRKTNPKDYFDYLNAIMNESTVERSFLNDTSPGSLGFHMIEKHLGDFSRFEFLVNREYKILFSCRPRGDNEMVVVTCMTIDSEYFRKYFMPKKKWTRVERRSVERLEMDKYGVYSY